MISSLGSSSALVNWLHRQQRELLEQLTQVEADLAHVEAAEAGKARQRTMALAASRARTFRDGTPKDKPGHKEVARRYAWQAHKNGKNISRPKPGETGSNKLIALIRLREIERLASWRYGAALTDDRVGRDFAEIAAHHVLGIGRDERHIGAWLRVWAPWMDLAEANNIARKAIARPVKYCADTLGWRLGLTGDERHELGITTIGAVGIPKARREAFRKLKARMRSQRRRKQAGAMCRALYEDKSLETAKPWVALGMSRATYYRRGKPRLPGEWKSRRIGHRRKAPKMPEAPSKAPKAPSKAPKAPIKAPKRWLATATVARETSPCAAGKTDIAVNGPVSQPARDGTARVMLRPCLSLPRDGPCALASEGFDEFTPRSVLATDRSHDGS